MLRWITTTWLLSLCCTVLVFAQDGVKPSVPETTPAVESKASESAAPSETRIAEVRPSIFYLPDKQGNLQAVIDFNYEDFVELYKIKQKLEQRDQRPRYGIQHMSITGTAGTESAELIVQFQIMVRDLDWVRVPLRLDQGLLREPPQYQGPGEHFVQFEGNDQGYVLWLRDKKEGTHDITFKMLVPLSLVGEETKLKLFTPRATGSELKLKVPEINVVGTVSDGATLLPLATGPGNETLFSVLGLGGEFQLAWHKTGVRATEVPVVLEATGNILARLDNQGMTSEVTLSVRSFGSLFDRFIVRLPPGSELTPGNFPGYSLKPIKEEGESEDRPSLVEVRLLKKTAGPVEVRLSTRRNFDQKQPSDGFDLAGFEVVGAARQWGAIAVAAGSDRQVVWGAHSGVRQIDILPEPLKAEGVAACFEYSAFPYMLNVRLAPRKTRINIDPEYVLFVDRNLVQLEAKLSCFIRGAKVNTLRLAMPDWEIDEAGPENLVAQDSIDYEENGLVSIPLQQPSSGKLELRLHAHKVLDKSAERLSVALPVPQILSPGPALVAVVPADNVELTPEADAIKGLIRQQIAPPMKLPERQQTPLFYRSDTSNAVFAAQMHVHSRRITVDTLNYVHLEEESARVEQRFNYFIAYEATDHILLDVPNVLAGPNRMEIRHNAKPLTAKILTGSAQDSIPAGMVRMSVNLPEASIGQYELVVQYNVSMPPLDISYTASWSVPLIVPDDVEQTGNKLYLTAAPGVKIVDHDNIWKLSEKDDSHTGRQDRLELQSDKNQESLILDVQLEDRRANNTTVVERAWIQTWLTSSARQDRAIFEFTTNQNELIIHIPSGSALEQMLVMLDGKRVEAQPAGENQVLLSLTGNGEIQSYLLELRYHFQGSRPPRGFLSFDFPSLGADVWTRRMYWQLVLPQNEHVLFNPPGFVGEYRWKWCGYFWGREPLLNQSQLENWIGTSQRGILSEGVSVYLYGVLGNANHAELRTISRTWIVSIASGGALIFGLLLIYVPLVRHPFSLLILSIGLLSLAMIYPEPAAMIAQASGLGLALTILAGLLERSMARRRKKVVVKEPSKAISDLASSHSSQPLAPAASASSTKALPAVVQPLPEEPSQ